MPEASENIVQRVRRLIHGLYFEIDVAMPTLERPIAPLGAILARLSLVNEEMAYLSRDSATEYLRNLGVLPPGITLGSDGATPLAGLLFATGTIGIIFCETNDLVTRRRFSVAHELAHFLLHFRNSTPADAGGDASSPFIDSVTNAQVDAIIGKDNSNEDVEADKMLLCDDMRQDEQREIEADIFAAELLMPANVVQLLASAYTDRLQLDSDDLSQRIAEDMIVSKAAMDRRLVTLGLVVNTKKKMAVSRS